MRALGLGLAVLAVTSGVVAGCGDTDSDDPNAAAGSSGQAVSASGAGGDASAGKGGVSAAGSNAGTTSAGASGSSSAGSSSGGTAGGREPGDGAAGAAGADSGLASCDLRKIMCKRLQPECPAGEVPSVIGTCYGDCVKIEECACSAAEDCPDANQYTCWAAALRTVRALAPTGCLKRR